jgi:site-specific DNA-methyltransferase (adenine-specific)
MSEIKLYNGDCLVEMDNIPDKSVDMILCDLPYGTTSCSWDVIIPFEDLWKQYNRVIKDNGAIVLFASQPFTSLLVSSNIKNFKHEWIWEKQKAGNFMGTNYSPLKYHENIVVFCNGSTKFIPQKYNVLTIDDIMSLNKQQMIELFDSREYDRYSKIDNRNTINDPTTNKNWIGCDIKRTRSEDDGTRFPKSVIKINKSINGNVHPTQKPVALLEYLIKTYSNEGDTILDNTMGSGSTGVACVNINRNFIGIELSKEYFDIASNRINEAQNKQKEKLF